MIKKVLIYIKYYWPYKRYKRTALGHYRYYEGIPTNSPENIWDIIHSAYYMRRHAKHAQSIYFKMTQGLREDQDLTSIIEEANKTLRFFDGNNKMKKATGFN